MGRAFGRDALLDAFDRIGEAAAEAGVVLHLMVYGGSALMLASNFRFATEDVDIAEVQKPWPGWLDAVVASIAVAQGWDSNWLNEGVAFHLSQLATIAGDHVEFGTFPRSDGEVGLVVHVPTAEYMLALKVKAIRIFDPLKGEQEADDIRNLMRVVGAVTAEDAIAAMARYFPRSAADPGKQMLLLRHVLGSKEPTDAPAYPVAIL